MTSAVRARLVPVALVGVAAVWGATFVVVKDAVELYPLYGFLALRFVIAVIALMVILPSSLVRMRVSVLGVGVLAGLLLAAGYILQTWGLEDTSASKAAFLTGLFVVMTPLLQAVLLRRRPRVATLAGVVLAFGGLWLLSGGGAGGWTVGDTRVVLCALAYSLHMIVLGGLGHRHDSRPLTLVQLATVAVVCGAISITTEPVALPRDGSVWIALVATGVFASAMAYAIQTYAQRHLSPTKTALILITEPAFGGIFGWITGERLGIGGAAGAALILGGMMVAELLGGPPTEAGERVELEGSVEGPPTPLAVESD